MAKWRLSDIEPKMTNDYIVTTVDITSVKQDHLVLYHEFEQEVVYNVLFG